MNNSKKNVCYECVNRKLDNLQLLCEAMNKNMKKIYEMVSVEHKKEMHERLNNFFEKMEVDTPRDRSRSTTPVKKKQRKKKASPKNADFTKVCPFIKNPKTGKIRAFSLIGVHISSASPKT